jgi:hypothetical protein
MSVSLAPPVRFKAFYPGTGNPLSGGQLWTLQPGTSGFGYLKASYSDSSGNTVNTNPVILDPSGEADVWLSGYTKLVLQDASGNQVWSRDNVSSSGAAGVGAGQWISQAGLLLTYVNATQFSTPGDETALFQVGMRLQAIVSAGTIYGTITASSSSGSPLVTTVTVSWDSGQLDTGLSAVATSIITPVHSGLPAPPVYVSNYASLTSAVAAIGSASMDLLINVPTTVTAATTVPGNISISVAEGGVITNAGGSLTINGSFHADGQAFSGFGAGQVTGLKEARPEWWYSGSGPWQTAIQAAVNSLSTGNVVLSSGTYATTGTITVSNHRINLIGQGPQATYIQFNPISAGQAAVVVQLGSTGPIVHNNIKNLSITSSDTTYQKVGLKLVDVSEFSVTDVSIDQLVDVGASSIGLSFNGRDTSSFINLHISADRPVVVGPDPNISTISIDCTNFHNTYFIATAQNANFEILSGCYPTNLSFTGSNIWANGGYGLKWADTATTENVQNLYVENLRWEQDGSVAPTGYMIYLSANSPNGGLVGATFMGCYTGVGNGFYFSRIERIAMINCQYMGSGIALNADANSYPLVLENWRNPSGSISTSTLIAKWVEFEDGGLISSAVFGNGAASAGVAFNLLPLNTDNPSAAIGDVFLLANTTATTLHNIAGGYEGKRIILVAVNNNTTLSFGGGNLQQYGSGTWTPNANSWAEAVFHGSAWWFVTHNLS